jgi:MYXO-CTERM domain-containing protein
LLLASACSAESDQVGIHEYEVSLASEVSAGGCSTFVADALSRQIIDEMACMAPGHFALLEEQPGIEFAGGAVYGLITADGKANLLAAVADQGGTLRINSGFRTVAQQYLLYRWWQNGQCGIPAAATPGRSNHESGRALDVGNYSTWKATLETHGWMQDVPGDPVHFDHVASGDSRGMDVHAFQRLWNRNNPNDLIDEDGVYGPMTADRLAAAPAEGFPVGACDPTMDPDPDPGTDPDPDPGTQPDPSDDPDGKTDLGSDERGADLTGGCSASGAGDSGAAWMLLALGLLLVRRRRISEAA